MWAEVDVTFSQQSGDSLAAERRDAGLAVWTSGRYIIPFNDVHYSPLLRFVQACTDSRILSKRSLLINALMQEALIISLDFFEGNGNSPCRQNEFVLRRQETVQGYFVAYDRDRFAIPSSPDEITLLWFFSNSAV